MNTPLTAFNLVEEIDRLKRGASPAEQAVLNEIKDIVVQADADSVYPTAELVDYLKRLTEKRIAEIKILERLRQNLRSMDRGRRPQNRNR
jgi:hypothetical protein